MISTALVKKTKDNLVDYHIPNKLHVVLKLHVKAILRTNIERQEYHKATLT